MRARKKPVEVEAVQLNLANGDYLARWCGGRQTDDGIVISTLEGDHLAQQGDWIICGVKGEFYPCKPDIFDATYEIVGDVESPRESS